MNIGSVAASPPQATEYSVTLSEGQEDQAEKVIGKVLSSISQVPAPSRDGFPTGGLVNIAA